MYVLIVGTIVVCIILVLLWKLNVFGSSASVPSPTASQPSGKPPAPSPCPDGKFYNRYHEGNENYDVCISRECAEDVRKCKERECGRSSELYHRNDRNQLLDWSGGCKFDQG